MIGKLRFFNRLVDCGCVKGKSKVLADYEGMMEPPDEFADPIGYRLWLEANRCPDCNGCGKYLPLSDHPREIYKAREGCVTCRGTGTAPHLFDPDF